MPHTKKSMWLRMPASVTSSAQPGSEAAPCNSPGPMPRTLVKPMTQRETSPVKPQGWELRNMSRLRKPRVAPPRVMGQP